MKSSITVTEKDNFSSSCQEPDAQVCIVTGLSGAGKSTALRVFEDLRFLTVDGLPASLAPELAAIIKRPGMSQFCGIALGMDMRQNNFLAEIHSTLAKLAEMGLKPKLLFLEADNKTLMRRYASSRRPHPLERDGIGLEAAIVAEQKQLGALKEIADLVVDTSRMSIHDLRRCIQNRWRSSGAMRSLRVHLLSFGFKYGTPPESDFVFDLRFLQNPYFIEELRPLNGQDKAVREYVFSYSSASDYKLKILDLLHFALPLMETEGRYRVTIALGCTGGKHRSVAMAEALAKILSAEGFSTTLEHRHLELG